MNVEESFSAYMDANILGIPKQIAYTWKRKVNEQQYFDLIKFEKIFCKKTSCVKQILVNLK